MSQNLASDTQDNLTVVGDFNLSRINWDTLQAPSSRYGLHFQQKFLNMTLDCFYTQHVNIPTHCRENQQQDVLDLVLTRDPDLVSQIRSLPPLGKSDHMKGLEAKGPFLCSSLQVRIKRAYQIPINFSPLWLVKYYLNNSSNYLNIFFKY